MKFVYLAITNRNSAERTIGQKTNTHEEKERTNFR